MFPSTLASMACTGFAEAAGTALPCPLPDVGLDEGPAPPDPRELFPPAPPPADAEAEVVVVEEGPEAEVDGADDSTPMAFMTVGAASMRADAATARCRRSRSIRSFSDISSSPLMRTRTKGRRVPVTTDTGRRALARRWNDTDLNFSW